MAGTGNDSLVLVNIYPVTWIEQLQSHTIPSQLSRTHRLWDCSTSALTLFAWLPLLALPPVLMKQLVPDDSWNVDGSSSAMVDLARNSVCGHVRS